MLKISEAENGLNCKYSREASEGYLLFCLLFNLFSPSSLTDAGEANLSLWFSVFLNECNAVRYNSNSSLSGNGPQRSGSLISADHYKLLMQPHSNWFPCRP